MENNHLENEEIITPTTDEVTAEEADIEENAEAVEEAIEETPAVAEEESVAEESSEQSTEEPADEIEEEPIEKLVPEYPSYTQYVNEGEPAPAEETLVVNEVEEFHDEIVAPAKAEKIKKEKKEKKRKIKDNEFDFDLDDEKDDSLDDGLFSFLRSVRFKRIWDKVCLALLLVAFAIPVGLLVYIILNFFL